MSSGRMIVELEEATRNLHADEDDCEIPSLLARAEGIVLGHLELEDYELDLEDPKVGEPVKAAVLIVLQELYDKRDSDPLTPAAISLLRPFRSVGVW